MRRSLLSHVQKFLAPTLKPGDIVIVDNLSSHKGKAVRKAIRDVGARLIFLPKYSPDMNPIEQVFAKLKGLLRKLAPRALPDLDKAVADILKAVPAQECANFLRDADYAST